MGQRLKPLEPLGVSATACIPSDSSAAWCQRTKNSVHPGHGKSYVTRDLCARLSTGRPMPDGSSGQASSPH
jgi:hypothetical protein